MAIVIVNYNSAPYVLKSLDCLFSEYLETQFQVYVIDNNSTDDNLDEVEREFPSIRLLKNNRNLGFAFANNQVLKRIDKEFVLLLNPDVIISPKTIDGMLRVLKNAEEVAGVGVRLLNEDGKMQRVTFWYPTYLSELMNTLNLEERILVSTLVPEFTLDGVGGVREVGWLSGSCCLYRMKALRQADYFDEGFFLFSEDLDLGYRLHKLGWKLWQLMDVSVLHYGSRSTSTNPYRTIIARHHGRYRFLKKHYSSLKRAIFCVIYEITLVLKMGIGLVAWILVLVLSDAGIKLTKTCNLEHLSLRNRAYWKLAKAFLLPGSREARLQKLVDAVLT